MSDYKNYVVQYDIRANVEQATQGFEKIAAIATQFEQPMKELRQAVSQVNSTLLSLKENANFKFTPQIDSRAFNQQLKSMVLQVRSAATQMHTALYDALKGNGVATNAMKLGIDKSLGIKSAKELANSIVDYERELDKLMGTRKKGKSGKTVRAKDGSILLAQNAGLNDRVLELKARKEAIQRKLAQTRAELAAAEQMEKEVASAQAKSAKTTQKTVPTTITTPQQTAKLTNVTPAVIKEWKKAFGDAKNKSLTVNISGNATGKNGALTVINQVQAALNALKEQAVFNINPTLNTEGFVAAEAQLKQLAALTQSVMAPFAGDTTKKQGKTNTLAGLTKEEQNQLQKAQAGTEHWQKKIDTVQKRLKENQEKYAQQPTSGLKGQITRDTKQLAQYKESLETHKKTIDQLQSKVSQSVQGQQKNIKPLSVDIIGNLSSINTNGKEFVVPVIGEMTKIQNKVKEAIPVNIKVMAEQINESLRSLPRPSLLVDVRLNTESATKQLQAINATPITTTTSTKQTVSTTPAATVKQTFPALTSSEQTQMNGLLSNFSKLKKAQEIASNNLARIKEKHVASGGSDRTFKQLQDANKKYSEAREAYNSAYSQLKPLMYKQFQSTASRALTDDEILQGIKAQNTVDQLLAKKRLTTEQKAELAQAQSALKALRAPLATPPVTTPTAKPVAAPIVPPVIPPVTTPTAKPVAAPIVPPVIPPVTTPTAKPVAEKTATKPQPTTVDVVANITGIRSIKEIEVPVIGKLNATNLKEQIKSIPRPTLPVNMKLTWEKGAIGKNEQLKTISDKIPPIVLKLDITKAIDKLNEFVAQVKAKSLQNITLTASGSTANAAKNVSMAATATTGTTIASSASNSGNKDKAKEKAAPTARKRYETMQKKALANTLSTKQKVEKWKGYNAQIENYHAERQRMYDSLFGPGNAHAVRQKMYDELFKAVPKQPEWKQAAERVKRLDDAVATFQKGFTPYEQSILTKNENTALENRKRRLARRQARISNAAIPFVQNQSQLNTVVKHFKYFKQAMATTGITPTQGMAQTQMLKYLQGVSQQMQQANVQIPWQLQNTINQLQAQITKATQAAAQAAQAAQTASKTATGSKSKVQTVRVAESPKSFYDRSRKWAYPFTGNTSFGATTPMAVDMAKGMGVMFAVGGAMSAVGNSFSEAVEYQNTMRTTNAILKNGTDTYTPSAFKNMEHTVRDVGIKTKFSAPEVADAARFLAMAGYDIEAINNSIAAIADLALIGDTDLGETADKMTNIMTTFGIKPEKMREAANIMTTTATRSNTDLMMLAESAKYGGGVANMYGYNDPNLFADTMAMFGIMGNAGIQASSAGTALRMMYQNIFKPNKNQKAVLEQLNKDYGISTLDALGNFRSMSDILVEMATRIPEDKMAHVVGNLFRITAQPGASAALRAAAQEDGSDETQVAGGINAVSDFVQKKGLSTLVNLMLANRESITGNISGNVAYEKQNTIKGLWAQVTSTFTEAILLAFEKNEGHFSEMLVKLRDYLAKPETVQMIQRLFDLIVNIGKVMAKFVEYWVGLYNMFPGIIEQWVKWQMIFTQIGSLISPVVAVISVFDRLRSALLAFSGIASIPTSTINAINTVGSTINTVTGTNLMNRGIIATPAPLGGAAIGVGIGRRKQTYYASASKYDKYITNAMIAAGFVERKWNKPNTWLKPNVNDRLNRELFVQSDNRLQVAYNNAQRYREIGDAKRAKQMANPELLSRVAGYKIQQGKWMSGLGTAYKAGAAYMSITGLMNMASSIKTMFSSLMVSLAKAVGLLVNPFTIAIGAIGGLGYWIYNLSKHANSATETQIQARKKLGDDFTQAFNEEKERHANVRNFLSNNGFVTSKMNDYQEDVDNIKNEQNKFASSYQYLFNKDIITSEGASRKSNKDIVDSLRKRYVDDATMRLALSAKEYEELLGSGLTISSERFEQNMLELSKNRPFDINHNALDLLSSAQIYNKATGEKDATINLLNKAAKLAVKNEGANDEKILKARNQIVELRKKLGDTEQFRIQAMSILNNTVNPYDFNLLGDEYINLANLENPNFDWSKLQSYAWAGYRVLENEINASRGSVIDSILAMEELKKGLIPYSERWSNAISRLVDNFRIIRNITFNGKVYDNIEVLMKTLPDGRLDFSNILKQIQDKIEGFKGNTKLFVEFANRVYQMLLDMGVMTDDSLEGRVRFAKEQLKNKGLTDKEIERYYTPTEDDKKRDEEEKRRKSDPFGFNNINIPEKPNGFDNAWKNYQNDVFDMMPAELPQIPMAAQDPTDSYLPKWQKDRKRKENNAVENMISEDAKKYIKQSNNINGNNGNSTINNNGVTNQNGNNLNNDKTNPIDQEEYASKYNRSSARPTQIVYNINNLANFDRTTVAANADERDLMQSMESKIAEMVYRVFAEAMNNANSMRG